MPNIYVNGIMQIGTIKIDVYGRTQTSKLITFESKGRFPLQPYLTEA
jgi:hypothetical protein